MIPNTSDLMPFSTLVRKVVAPAVQPLEAALTARSRRNAQAAVAEDFERANARLDAARAVDVNRRPQPD